MKYNRKRIEAENKDQSLYINGFRLFEIPAHMLQYISKLMQRIGSKVCSSQLTESSGSGNPLITVEHFLHCWIQTYYQRSSISTTQILHLTLSNPPLLNSSVKSIQLYLHFQKKRIVFINRDDNCYCQCIISNIQNKIIKKVGHYCT